MRHILHTERKEVRNYPLATQVVFAAIQLVPAGHVQVPALQYSDIRHV